MKTLLHCLALALLLAAAPLSANTADVPGDPLTERRMLDLTMQLRCLVCQNQSIADSNAELAVDLKREVRQMIADGRSDREIMDFMVERYGDFVLYNPPVKAVTLLLWGGPLLLMIVVLGALIHHLRRRNRQALEDAPLSTAEQQQATALLDQNTK